MNSNIRIAVLGGMASFVLLLSGCQNTPFVPVAVPEATSLRPDPPVNRAREYAELEKLQRVKAQEYLIAPGDVFALVVTGQEKLSRPQVTVLPDGSISVAPVGSVRVAGLTLPGASRLLNDKYRKYVRNCNVVLEPMTLKNYTFTIGGTVAEPGIYPFVFGSFRLTDAVAMAKGLLSTGNSGDKMALADLANAYIARDGRILPVDFTKALVAGDPLYNIPIMNGDYIYIPSQETGKVTVLGEVSRPNCIPYQPDLTLLQAVAISGGLKETNSSDIKVIRGGLKSPVVYNINIKNMQLGRIRDFALKPKDIVFVPRDPISEWNVIMRLILPTVQFLNGLAGPFGNPASTFYN